MTLPHDAAPAASDKMPSGYSPVLALRMDVVAQGHAGHEMSCN